MKPMQCWDDGVTTDVRLVSLLRRHGARATFNLNAGLHARERRFGWQHQGTEVWRLGHDELREVYAGFTIANHTLTHPHLAQLPLDGARREIVDGRARLQDLFGQPVRGFVYPFGIFDAAVAQAVRGAGGAVVRPNRPVHRKPGFNLPPCPLPTRTQALLVRRLALLVLAAAAFGTPLTQAADFASQWPACAP